MSSRPYSTLHSPDAPFANPQASQYSLHTPVDPNNNNPFYSSMHPQEATQAPIGTQENDIPMKNYSGTDYPSPSGTPAPNYVSPSGTPAPGYPSPQGSPAPDSSGPSSSSQSPARSPRARIQQPRRGRRAPNYAKNTNLHTIGSKRAERRCACAGADWTPEPAAWKGGVSARDVRLL
jgi:hypothetical protein